MKTCRFLGLLALLLGMAGCSSTSPAVRPVQNFNLNRYLGKWYEIARFDQSFERDLSRVTAEYRRRPDGGVLVINRGYNTKTGRWQVARGIGRPAGDPTVGSLRVSFFRPFWAGYHVIALDAENYHYAMVTSDSRSSLWILAREKTLPHNILSDLILRAKKEGFEIKNLIFIQQQ